MVVLVIGGGLGPLFAGAVADQTGSYQIAFATYAALNACALAGCCFIRNEREKVQPA